MDSLTATLQDTSSERAQQQIDALRTAIETRLAALEAVLSDPSRGESLEGLILDLARVAGEEARAVALKATLDARLDADTRVAEAKAAAQETVDQERIVAGELRRTIEQARQRIASLEQGQLAQLHTLRKDLETEIAHERAAATSLEQAVAQARGELQTEREAATAQRRALEEEREAAAELRRNLEQERAAASGLRHAAESGQQTSEDLGSALASAQAAEADLRRALQHTEEQSRTLAREKAEAWTAQDALTMDLARERDGAARLQRLNADLQAQLDAERTSSAELRQTAAAVEQQLTHAASDTEQLATTREELQRDLETARTEKETIRVDLEAAGVRLEMLDSERLRADRARKELEARVDALIQERDALTTDLEAARKNAEAPTSKLVAATAPALPAIAPPIAPVAAAPPAAPHAPAKPVKPAEEDWGAVRLAVRYSFRQPVPVQINGDAGVLVDLSVAGCQLVSSTSVRPNQMVKVLLPSEEAPIVCAGKVMWARFEARAAGGGIGYRAGVHFTKPDQPALESFISASRLPPPQ